MESILYFYSIFAGVVECIEVSGQLFFSLLCCFLHNPLKPLSVFTEGFTLEIWKGPKYASDIYLTKKFTRILISHWVRWYVNGYFSGTQFTKTSSLQESNLI